MVLSISGKINSGKDTIGKIIQALDWYHNGYKNSVRNRYTDIEFCIKVLNEEVIQYSEWRIKKFAGKLKQIVSMLTGIPIEELEKQEVKDMVLREEWNYSFETVGNNVVSSENSNIAYTIRSLLQRIGTEAMRNVIHPNVWVNALFSEYKPINEKVYHSFLNRTGHLADDSELEYPNWIITDTRFPNELEAVKNRGGITIRVDRGLSKVQYEQVTTPFENVTEHPSETSLDNATFDYTIENNGTLQELVEKVKQILITEKIITA